MAEPSTSPFWRILAKPGLTTVLGAVAASAYGFFVSQLALSWAALESTGSSLAVGLVFAVRMLPPLAFGLMGGRLADMVDRRRLTIMLNLLGAAASIGVALTGGLPTSSLLFVLLVSFGLGMLDTPRLSASQALVYDVAGRDASLRALALANLTAHLVGIVAGIVGGLALSRYGVAAVFVTIAGAQLIAVTLLSVLRPGQQASGLASPFPPADPTGPFGTKLLDGVGAPRDDDSPTILAGIVSVLREPAVRVIAVAAVAAEIFAFSSVVLLPAFSETVFRLGAGGLGLMFTARSVGAVAGLLSLPVLRQRFGGGILLLLLTGVFATALLVFALVAHVAVAFAALVVVGGAGAAIDALNQTLLQQYVPERARGSAMGVWVSAIGTGPVGQLEAGALAAALGPAASQAINALLLLSATIVIAVLSPIRRLR